MARVLPDGFVPRKHYQAAPWNAIIRPDFKRGMLVWPRRNGKDLFCWNLVVAKAMQRVGTYYYIAPYYNQARQIIWEGVDGSGRRFLDYCPNWLISGLRNKGREKQEMRQRLPNGSQIKLLGSDKIDSIVGTNPIGIIFTEFSLHKRGAWDYLRPVLAENGGWSLMNGTPRGTSNEFYELYDLASQPNSSWYLQHLTRDDTGYPSLEAIEEDRRSGMPEALVQQEYYTSFLSGNVGTYYSTEMEMLRQENRFVQLPWDPRYPVYTFWDLGKKDACAIWFVQIINQQIRLIDYHEAVDKSLISNIKEALSRPYLYGDHFAPHDIAVEEMSNKKLRWDTAAEHGIDFVVVPKLPLQDGIEAVRSVLPRCWFNLSRCDKGIKALKNYHKSYDAKTETYSDAPARSWANHGSDAFRYMAVMIDMIAEFSAFENAPPQVIRSIGHNSKIVRLDSRRRNDPISGIAVGADYLAPEWIRKRGLYVPKVRRRRA
jgi:phage terminase large subunit